MKKHIAILSILLLSLTVIACSEPSKELAFPLSGAAQRAED